MSILLKSRYNCQKIGLFVHSLNETDQIDIAFDGCDIDYSLNTLKSGGNIYLYEKIAAQMSKEYILLLPQERIQKELSTKVPLSIEVASPTVKQIMNFCHSLNLKAELRLDTSSFARSPLGNLIIDIYKPNWNDIAQINEQLLKQNGVIASSYFPTW
ncbi:ribose-5-phosphate isomerase A [Lactobacillus acidophilus]